MGGYTDYLLELLEKISKIAGEQKKTADSIHQLLAADPNFKGLNMLCLNLESIYRLLNEANKAFNDMSQHIMQIESTKII